MIYDTTKPCANCPYRKDSPKKLWAREEFEDLLANDGPNGGQNFAPIYACHKGKGKPANVQRPCVGWLLDQKKRNVPSFTLRLILASSDDAFTMWQRIHARGLKLFASIAAMCRANGVR